MRYLLLFCLMVCCLTSPDLEARQQAPAAEATDFDDGGNPDPDTAGPSEFVGPPASGAGGALPGEQETEMVVRWVHDTLIKWGVPEAWQSFSLKCVGVAIMLLFAVIADLIARRGIVRVASHLVKRTQTAWDDIFMQRNVLRRVARLVPALVVYVTIPVIFPDQLMVVGFVRGVALLYMLLVMLLALYSTLDAVIDIYRTFEVSRRMPIKGFLQVLKIILFVIAAIIALSVVTDESPNFFLGGLGAMTAVLMLIFKDSILGLVAGVQLSANNMVRIGDWVEMSQFGADGDVIDVTLTTVKVQNWDKTISTIPTYALISQSFKNWRGMTESQGRRIKRSLLLDMTSVKFLDAELKERLSKITLLEEYLGQKESEITDYNKKLNIADTSLANGRRLTNLGTFRAYIAAYLREHPAIHKDMTFLVRQLAPSSEGVAIEMYVFSSDKNWVNYEGIQSDIFDHLLAVVPEFELRVFQTPTGADLQQLPRLIAKGAQ